MDCIHVRSFHSFVFPFVMPSEPFAHDYPAEEVGRGGALAGRCLNNLARGDLASLPKVSILFLKGNGRIIKPRIARICLRRIDSERVRHAVPRVHIRLPRRELLRLFP